MEGQHDSTSLFLRREAAFKAIHVKLPRKSSSLEIGYEREVSNGMEEELWKTEVS